MSLPDGRPKKTLSPYGVAATAGGTPVGRAYVVSGRAEDEEGQPMWHVHTTLGFMLRADGSPPRRLVTRMPAASIVCHELLGWIGPRRS